MTTPVAAFDFDGTITRRDTFFPFLVRTAGRRRAYSALVAQAPLIRVRDADERRDRAKAALLRRLLRNRRVDDLRADAQVYADGLVDLYRPEMLEKIAWHRSAGHRLVLISASLALYAAPAARALGFDDAIAVELVERDGRFTGEMVGPNVRARQKAERLRAWLAADDAGDAEIWAYGDSPGDRHLLAAAHHPTWV